MGMSLTPLRIRGKIGVVGGEWARGQRGYGWIVLDLVGLDSEAGLFSKCNAVPPEEQYNSTQSASTEHLLYARHCSRHLGLTGEQNRGTSLPLWSVI